MDNMQIIVILLLALIIVWWFMSRREKFNQNTTEFVSVGSERYGLRGDLLHRRPIEDYFIGQPIRNHRFNESGGVMTTASNPPSACGCNQIPCPHQGGAFDELDHCWQCQA